ncbi:ABC transporter substrate-binding protein [Brevibacillus ruminantium]
MKAKYIGIRNWMLTGIAAVLFLTGCGSATPANNASAPNNTPSQETAKAGDGNSTNPVTVQIDGRTVTFTEVPKRAVSLNQHVTEVMLALGLEDKMAGTAYLDDSILPEYQDAYAKVPVLSAKYPSKEVLLAAEPDFVYAGWKSAFTEKAVGTIDGLEKLGIKPYLHQSSNMTGPEPEDVFADISNIGRIFRVEEKADELIEKIKKEMKEITDRIGEQKEPLRVFVYDNGEDQPFTAANNYMTTLIRLAGGKNVFDDIPKGWTTTSWEEVVARKADVIVIVDYGDKTVEQKRNFLLSKKELAELPAIQNKRLIVLPLSAAAEGVRAPLALQTLAEGFYPEAFKQ